MLLTNPASILEVPGPGQAEGPALEVSVGEHVGQAELIVVLLCNMYHVNILTVSPVQYHT